MNLPPEFISIIQNTFEEKGNAFLDALPDMIEEASVWWGLTDIQPSPELSYNFVAFAKHRSENVVLKIGVPRGELRSEIEALKLFNGDGSCRLIDHDPEKCWMLLERLEPGVMLSTLEDDDEATRIGAEVMKRIWRALDTPSSAASGYSTTRHNTKFIQLIDWFEGLKRLRKMFDGRTGPLSEKIVERVEGSVNDLFAVEQEIVLMHGDFHHYNILSSDRGWLVIDPKGVIGPAGYEVGPFIMNPWKSLPGGEKLKVQVMRRIDILSEQLGFERDYIIAWSLAHAVLSAWWGIEDHTDWEYSADFAGLLAGLK